MKVCPTQPRPKPEGTIDVIIRPLPRLSRRSALDVVVTTGVLKGLSLRYCRLASGAEATIDVMTTMMWLLSGLSALGEGVIIGAVSNLAASVLGEGLPVSVSRGCRC